MAASKIAKTSESCLGESTPLRQSERHHGKRGQIPTGSQDIYAIPYEAIKASRT